MKYHNEKQAMLIFLDTEKVFDNLNLTFPFKILNKMEFGENFITWMKSI